jgi:hypothetical protein
MAVHIVVVVVVVDTALAAAHLLVPRAPTPAAVPSGSHAGEKQADRVCRAHEEVCGVQCVEGCEEDVHGPFLTRGFEGAVFRRAVGEEKGDGNKHEFEAEKELLDADGLVLDGYFGVVLERIGADEDLEDDLEVC